MDVYLVERETGEKHLATILPALKKDMPLRKHGWQFNWKALSKIKNSLLYKIVLDNDESKLQGMLMLTLVDNEMLFMDNVEVAPHNFGREEKYSYVAGCLIAFASKMSFELGKGNYVGFLVFESKTALIELYQQRYGAEIAMGQRMFIDDVAGKKLIKTYLGIDMDDLEQ